MLDTHISLHSVKYMLKSLFYRLNKYYVNMKTNTNKQNKP